MDSDENHTGNLTALLVFLAMLGGAVYGILHGYVPGPGAFGW